MSGNASPRSEAASQSQVAVAEVAFGADAGAQISMVHNFEFLRAAVAAAHLAPPPCAASVELARLQASLPRSSLSPPPPPHEAEAVAGWCE